MDQAHMPPSGETKPHFHNLEEFFEYYLVTKVPFQLPANVKEFIVKYGPWITLVLMVLALPFFLAAIGMSILFLPFAAFAHPFSTMGGMIHFVIAIGVFVLELIALPALFRRSLSGWKLIYYGILLSAVGNLLSMDLGGFIIGLLLGMYLLFQVKSYYK